MDEIWKDKKDYEGLYQVSNWGRVKSFKFGKERILKQFTNNDGYLQVHLCKNGKLKTFLVHRLVAEAFLDNPNNLPQVNHKDENPQNNNVENLEFCSAKYNTNFGTRNKRISDKNTNGKLSKPVLQFTLDGQFVKEWPSVRQAEREGGFNQSHITDCCRGKIKTHKNFIWKYK